MTALFGALESGFELWIHKDKMKFVDELAELKQAYYDEYNRTPRDNAVLDRIEFRLRILQESFSAQIRAQELGLRSSGPKA